MKRAIEIKFTLTGDVEATLEALHYPKGEQRSIWFLEQLRSDAVGRTIVQLLPSGLILRLRAGLSGDDDSTIKLRPCEETQLTGMWREDFEEDDLKYRVEGDWAGTNRVLAASCVADHPNGTVAATIDQNGGVPALFLERQRSFLAACTQDRVDFSDLVVLGPITADRWKSIDIGGLDVASERWRVAGMDFLEFSIRVKDSAQAPAQQNALRLALQSKGLNPQQGQETKTRQVLEILATQSSSPVAKP